jgi:N-acetylmuramoyl-L-alanine amidase
MPKMLFTASQDQIRGFMSAAFAALFLSFSSIVAQAEPLRVEGLRAVGDASRARVVIDVSQSPDLRWFLVRSPHRLVLELGDVEYRHED